MELNNVDLAVGEDEDVRSLVESLLYRDFWCPIQEDIEDNMSSMVETCVSIEMARLALAAVEAGSNNVGDRNEEQSSSSEDSDTASVVVLDAPEEPSGTTLDSFDHRRPFECDVCSHKFKQKWHLKQHKLDKHQPRQFPCLLCDRPFSRKGSRRRHSIKVHNAHFCEVPCCQLSFPSRGELFTHWDTAHKGGLCNKSNVTGRWLKCLSPDRAPSPIFPDNIDDDLTSSFYTMYSSSSSSSSYSFGTADSSSFRSILSSDSSLDISTRSWSPPYIDTFTLLRNDDTLGPSVTYGTISDTTFAEASLSVAMSVTALVFCHIFGPENIDSRRIGEIFRIGSTLHRCCCLRHGPRNNPSAKLMAKLVTGRFFCDSPNLKVIINLTPDAMIQDGFELGGTFTLSEIKHFLGIFLTSNFQFAIFTFDSSITVAFIKKHNCAYLFECHAGRTDHRSPPSFQKFESLDLAYNYVKNDVLPTPFDEFDEFTYSIEIFDIATV